FNDSESSQDVTSATDSAHVGILPAPPANPQIALDKSGPATATAGDKVAYVLTVTNPGNVAIPEPVTVTDDQCNGDPVTLIGKGVKKVRKIGAQGLRYRVNTSKLKLGVHRIVANITFTAGSGTKPKTLRMSFQRCAHKLLAPRFTG